MAVIKISAEEFQHEVMESPMPVLVDFYADWCGPCKMLSPIVEEIAQEKPDCKVVKLNVDDAPSIAAKYQVMSIPTLIVFKNGTPCGQIVGVQSKQNILNIIN